MGRVSLVRHQGDIRSSLSRALDLIGGPQRYVGPNDRVLLKPNLNDVAVYTNISLTESLLQMLMDLRATEFAPASRAFVLSALMRATSLGSFGNRLWPTDSK